MKVLDTADLLTIAGLVMLFTGLALIFGVPGALVVVGAILVVMGVGSAVLKR